MQISLNFDTLNPADVKALNFILANLDGALKTQATPVAEAQPAPAPAPAAEAPAPAKRGRKAKEEAAAQVEKPAPDAGGSLAPSVPEAGSNAEVSDAVPTAKAASDKELSIDDVRAALQQFTVAHGVPKGIELLKEYGASRISELGAEHYAAFVEACAA